MNKIKLAPGCIVRSFVYPLLIICGQSLAVAAGAQDTVNRIKDVKITGVKLPEINTSAPVQSITKKDFIKNNAGNVADAIRNFAGVNIKDYGGIGGLKTVSVRSLGANHSGVFYDGIPLNDAQNGQVDLGKYNLDNIASIALYNAQPPIQLQTASAYAFGAVMFISPAMPDNITPFYFNAGIKGGSFGLFEPSIQYRQQLNKQWSIGGNTTFTTANGRYRYKIDGDGSDGRFTRNNGDLTTSIIGATLNFTPDSSSNIRLTANYYKSERGLPGAVVFYNDHSAQRLWNEDWLVQGNYKNQINRRWAILLNTKISQAYAKYLDPEFLNAQRFLDQRYIQNQYFQSAAVYYQPVKNIQLAYAADGVFNTLRSNLYQFVYPVRFTFLQNFAAQWEFSWAKVSANILQTSISERIATGAAAPAMNKFSPTITLVTHPALLGGFQWRGFYKAIFRAPTFNDLYYSRLGNKALKPETATQYNLGLFYNKAFSGKLTYLSLTADAYYNAVKDKIIAVPSKDLFSWTMLNLGAVDIRGLDVNVKTAYQANKEIQVLFTGTYTFQKAVDITDPELSVYLSQIPYVPVNTIALNAGLQYKDFRLFYNQIYTSHRYYLSENLPMFYVPGFSVADASLSWIIMSGKHTLKTAIEISNLFNTSYSFIRSFPMPGRSFRVSFHVTL